MTSSSNITHPPLKTKWYNYSNTTLIFLFIYFLNIVVNAYSQYYEMNSTQNLRLDSVLK
jgi:hypothetical protein